MSDLPDSAPVIPGSVAFADPDRATLEAAALAKTKPDSDTIIPAARRTARDVNTAPADSASTAPRQYKNTSTDPGPTAGFQSGNSAIQHARDNGNWFDQNRGWVIPLATAAGAVASSDSRYLGSALLQGLGAGAQSYGKEQSDEAALAKQQQEAEGTRQDVIQKSVETQYKDMSQEALVDKLFADGKISWETANAIRKKLIRVAVGPNGKLTFVDMGAEHPNVLSPNLTPGAPPLITPPERRAEPIVTPERRGAETAPITPETVRRAAVTTIPEGAQAPATAADLAGAADHPGPYQANLDATTTKDLADANARSDAAAKKMIALDNMTEQMKSLPNGGILAPGAGINERTAFANKLNNIAIGVFGKPVFDVNQVASVQDITKNANAAAMAMQGQPGAEVITRAMASTPSAENSKEGFARVAASMRQSLKYEQDRATFINNYKNQFGHTQGANEMFMKYNKPETYAREAVIDSIPPKELKDITGFVTTHRGKDMRKAFASFDKIHGAGTAELITGVKP